MTSTAAIPDNVHRRRWLRITYRNANGGRSTFTGLVWMDGRRIRGEAKHSTAKAPNDITLEAFYGDLNDVVKVERLNPVYQEWETLA